MKKTLYVWMFKFAAIVSLVMSDSVLAQITVESGYVCSVSIYPSSYVSTHGQHGFILFETNSAAKCAGSAMSKYMVLTTAATDAPINSALLHSRDDLTHLYEQLVALARSGSKAYYSFEADSPIWGVFKQFGWLTVRADM